MSDNNVSDTGEKPAPGFGYESENPQENGRSPTEIAQFEQSQFGAGGAAGLARSIRGYQYVAPPAPGYDVHGIWHSFPVHTRSGYAAHAVALHMMLLDGLKITTAIIPHKTSSIDIDKFPADRFDMLLKWMNEVPGYPETMICSLPPDLAMFGQSRTLVNYVAFEATRVSDFTLGVCNDEALSALWCVSDFTRRAFVDTGVHAEKVFTVRPAICDGAWRDMFLPITGGPAWTNGEKFRLMTVGTWHERKGFHDLVRAYFGAFKREEPVELTIATSHYGDSSTIKRFREQVIGEIAKIAKSFGDENYPTSQKMPTIRLLLGTDLSDSELIARIGGADCYVNPSYGEGLGIPAMWAAAQGCSVVSSDFGAVGEFLRDMPDVHSFVFKAQLEQVPPSMIRLNSVYPMEGALWGKYDIADLSSNMRAAFDAWDGGRGLARSPGGARATRKHFSYDECLPGLRKALSAVCRPEIMLEKWGLTPEGV